MAGRPNGAAEDEIRLKRFSRNMAAVMEAELKLNGLSKERNIKSQREHKQVPRTSTEEVVEVGDISILDNSSLPNSPDPTRLDYSPVLGLQPQSPLLTNPQIQKLAAHEPVRNPSHQE